jgi:hypothetical protein
MGGLALGHIAGRWVSYPLGGEGMRISADAITLVGAGRRRAGAWRRRGARQLRVDGLRRGAGPARRSPELARGAGRFVWLGRSSTAALAALAARHTSTLAGVHLTDGARARPTCRTCAATRAPLTIVLITLGAGRRGWWPRPATRRRSAGRPTSGVAGCGSSRVSPARARGACSSASCCARGCRAARRRAWSCAATSGGRRRGERWARPTSGWRPATWRSSTGSTSSRSPRSAVDLAVPLAHARRPAGATTASMR